MRPMLCILNNYLNYFLPLESSSNRFLNNLESSQRTLLLSILQRKYGSIKNGINTLTLWKQSELLLASQYMLQNYIK